MSVEINYLAVLLATLSSFAVGFVWYAKPVFGDKWQKFTGMTDAKAKTGMGSAMGMALVASALTAYVLAHVTYLSHEFFGNSYLYDALMTAFLLWLGISATTIVTHDAFEQRRKKLSLINMGNQLATFLVMGLIIGLLSI